MYYMKDMRSSKLYQHFLELEKFNKKLQEDEHDH